MSIYFITLLRHGESEGNLTGIIQGQSDYPLTLSGERQAKQLSSYWKTEGIKFDSIISSPLLRASQTAKIISSELGASIEYDPIWKERYFGELQGQKLEAVYQNNPSVDFFHPYDPIGGDGESQIDLYVRASQALQKLLRYPHGSYLVVSHGGILNKALFVIMGITPQSHHNSPIFHFGNTGYAQFRYNPTSRQWAVLSLNNQIKFTSIEGNNDWKSD